MLEFVNKVNTFVFKVAPATELPPVAKVGIFVGSWDMSKCYIKIFTHFTTAKIATVPTTESVSTWITKGSQIYVIGIQVSPNISERSDSIELLLSSSKGICIEKLK